MTQLQLFDSIQLTESIALSDGNTAPAGTPGAIVEIFNNGEAYLVELFGSWVTLDGQTCIPSDHGNPQAFRPTIGVEVAYPHQLHPIPSHFTLYSTQPTA